MCYFGRTTKKVYWSDKRKDNFLEDVNLESMKVQKVSKEKQLQTTEKSSKSMEAWKRMDDAHSVYNVLPLSFLQRKCLYALDIFSEIFPLNSSLIDINVTIFFSFMSTVTVKFYMYLCGYLINISPSTRL